MPLPITVPRLGWSMEEGTFGEWLKAPGEFVRAGEMLFVLEGEKSAQEIESFDSGRLCVPADAPQPGDTVKVGDLLGFLLADGEPAPVSVRTCEPHAAASPPPTPTPARSEPPASTAAPSPNDARSPVATPRARRRAEELGVDWTRLRGTGRNGRIRERDVLAGATARIADDGASAQEPAPTEPGRHVPASRLRRTIAQRMSAGVHRAAPVTLTTKVDAQALVARRERLRAEAAGGPVPSYGDILVHLAAQTLRELPDLNACWHRDGIHVYDVVHVAVAVDAPDGLLAPVVRDADRLTLDEIAEQTRRFAAEARAGRLSQDRLSGGTFTVTNLGMFGIDAFTPILNLPQAAILGVGRIVEEPVVRHGRLEVGRTITLSLTFDHRVVDGAPAARWLQALGERIRDPNCGSLP